MEDNILKCKLNYTKILDSLEIWIKGKDVQLFLKLHLNPSKKFSCVVEDWNVQSSGFFPNMQQLHQESIRFTEHHCD